MHVKGYNYFGNVFNGISICEVAKESDKFYVSIVELSNGRICSIFVIDSYSEIDLCYAREITIEPTVVYKFSDSFSEWWEKTFEFRELEFRQDELSFEEDSVVRLFHNKVILPLIERN
jgi:hypothetical protein